MFSPETFSNRKIAAAMAAIMAVAVLGLAGCSQEEAKADAKQQPVVRPVKVVEIMRNDAGSELSYSGSVHARTEMMMGFRVAGKITERLVDIGDRVKPGDVVARLDPTDYELQVASAKANLEAAERQVATAKLVRNRAEELVARKIAAQSQLDQAALSYDQAVASRDSAHSALDQANNQVQYADLKADRAGIVTTISADAGQVVGQGTPVITVAVDGEKEVQIAVPETEIAAFKPGWNVTARFWSNDDLTLDGKVREVAGSADAQSRTFAVRVSLPNDARILLGMTATVSARADTAARTVSVPLSALAKQGEQPIVWIVDRKADTVHARPVKVGDFTPDGIAITDGLAAGDVVVAAGTQFMTENLKVKMPTDEQSATAAGIAGKRLQ